MRNARRQWFSGVVRGDTAAFAGRREGVPGAGHASVRKRDVCGGCAARAASAGALCRALGLNRSLYDAVVRRYRDEVGAGRWPRGGTDSERMPVALGTSRDVRFASRRTRPAA